MRWSIQRLRVTAIAQPEQAWSEDKDARTCATAPLQLQIDFTCIVDTRSAPLPLPSQTSSEPLTSSSSSSSSAGAASVSSSSSSLLDGAITVIVAGWRHCVLLRAPLLLWSK